MGRGCNADKQVAVGAWLKLKLFRVAKLEVRKRFILETAKRLSRPIWAGDVAIKAVDQELYRVVFRALVDEGKLVRRSGAKGARAYYFLE